MRWVISRFAEGIIEWCVRPVVIEEVNLEILKGSSKMNPVLMNLQIEQPH
jgi:hypothetical protein